MHFAPLGGRFAPVEPVRGRVLPTPYTPLVHPLRVVALLACAALMALAGGCGGRTQPRFDALPGPVGTTELAAAALAEPEPLTLEEWARLDALHDAYLADFDALRAATLAPLARDARRPEARTRELDLAALRSLMSRHASAMNRIQLLDDALAAAVAEAMPERARFAERVAARRAIDRAARVVEGLADGTRDVRTVIDLEPLVDSLGLDRAQRTAVEPQVAAYRRALAAAARSLADAEVGFPAAWAALLSSQGLDPGRIDELQRAAEAPGATDDDRKAWKSAKEQIEAARLAAGRARGRALLALDRANESGAAEIAAALGPETGAALLEALERRRTDDPGPLPALRTGLLILEAHPDVRSGAAAGAAQAAREARRAWDALVAARVARGRERIEAVAEGLAPDDPARDKPVLELASPVMSAIGRARADLAARDARDPVARILQGDMRLTDDQARDLVAPVIGERTAARIVAAAPSSLFVEPPAVDEPPWREELSIAEQMALAPGMDRAAFMAVALALGASGDDPLVEEVWSRHAERSGALEAGQREQLKAMEKRATELAGGSQAPTGEFERVLSDYLRAVLAADAERLAADDESLREAAIVLRVEETDVRMALARAAGAARRAALPWRRYRQAWLLGPLWSADFDPVGAVLATPDPLAREATLAVLAPHAEPLRAAAEAARRAGLETLRDLLVFGLRQQRESRRARSPEEYRLDPEVQAMERRIAETARARREALRAAVEAVESLDASAGRSMRLAWARATVPEFFAEGRSWRDAHAEATAPPRPDRGTAEDAMLRAATDRWLEGDAAMVERLLAWQDAPRTDALPDSLDAARVLAATDAEFGAIRSVRDEGAARLMRAMAIAERLPPTGLMRDARVGQAPARMSNWSP